MRKTVGAGIFVLAVLLMVGQPVWAASGTPVQLVPFGKVTLLENGKPAQQFKSAMPLPQGLMLMSSGKSLLQANGLQLMAHDKAVFALQQGSKHWNLSIKSGRIDFALRPNAEPITFHTPNDLLQTRQAVVSASSNGLIKGYVEVAGGHTKLAVAQGALRVTSSHGSQVVQNGHTLVLAQAMGTAGAAGAATGTAAPVVTSGLTTGVITGGVGVAAIGVGAGSAASGVFKNDNDHHQVSPYGG